MGGVLSLPAPLGSLRVVGLTTTGAILDGASAFEPIAVDLDYEPPPAQIDPRTELGWMRRLWPLLRARLGAFALAIGFGLLALVTQIAVPAVLRDGIDNALDKRSSSLAPYVWTLIGLAVARFIFGGLYRYLLFRAAYRVETDLRAVIYQHLTKLSFSFYDRTQSGQVISRANSDIRSIQLLLAFGPLVLMSGLTFILAFAYMMSIHVGLTLVALSTMPGVYWSGLKLRQKVFPLSWVVQARMAEMATVVDENIQGVRVVQSFAQERAQITLLARAAQKLRWASIETAINRARWSPIIEALPRAGSALVLLYGGKLAIDGRVTVGTLVAFNAYVIVLQTPFRMLGFLLIQSQRAGASAGRIYEVLDEVPDIVDSPTAHDLIAPEGRVEFRDVVFRYAPRLPAVLDGASFVIEPGERVAIVGRTGSGKSTIARVLPRFYDVESGSARIDGIDVRDLTLASVRHHVSLVLDEAFLFSVSLRDNIAFGRPAASMDDVIAAARARAGPRLHHGSARGIRDRRRRTRLHAVGRAAPAHRHRPHAARESEDLGARRRHERHRRHHRGCHPRRAPHADAAPHDDHHRPPPVDDQPRRAGAVARRRSHRRVGHPRRLDGERAALCRRVGPGRGQRPRRRRHPDHGRDRGGAAMMTFGGGPSSVQANAAAGLPHAGVPGSLAQKVDEVLQHEPEHEEPIIEFTRSQFDRRPFGLRSFLAPQWLALLGAFVLVIVETIALQAGPFVTKIAIDSGINKKDYLGRRRGDHRVLRVDHHQQPGHALRVAFTGRLGERLMYALRIRVFTHLSRQSMAFFTDEKAGVLMTA